MTSNLQYWEDNADLDSVDSLQLDEEDSPPPKYSLETAMKRIRTLASPEITENSIKIWCDGLMRLAIFSTPDPGLYTLNTCQEVERLLCDLDIGTLVQDFNRVVDIIETKIKVRRSIERDRPVADGTRLQSYVAISKLYGPIIPRGLRLFLEEDLIKKYEEKIDDWRTIVKSVQGQNQAEGGNALNPTLTWEEAEKRLDHFINTKPMGNTLIGFANLRDAILVALYVLHPPRRLRDYALLELWDHEPSGRFPAGKNILVMTERSGAKLMLDNFKTRRCLPRYDTPVHPRLYSLFKIYVKLNRLDAKLHSPVFFKGYSTGKYNGTDMTRELWASFVKKKEPLYKPNFDDDGFALMLHKASQNVLDLERTKKTGLRWSCDCFRHIYSTWIYSQPANTFDDNQLRQMAIAVGDSTSARHSQYRMIDQGNTAATEINDIQDIKDVISSKDTAPARNEKLDTLLNSVLNALAEYLKN
jgi:hypothetical protein